jgi:hypothetical protein
VWLRAVCGDVFDGLGEQGVEGLTLGEREWRENLVVDLEQRAVEVGQESLAAGGELDDRAATVGPVAVALDEACVVEAVQDRDKIGGIDAEQFDERLLWGRPALAKVLQRVELAGAQAQWLDCLLDTPAHPAGEL